MPEMITEHSTVNLETLDPRKAATLTLSDGATVHTLVVKRDTSVTTKDDNGLTAVIIYEENGTNVSRMRRGRLVLSQPTVGRNWSKLGEPSMVVMKITVQAAPAEV